MEIDFYIIKVIALLMLLAYGEFLLGKDFILALQGRGSNEARIWTYPFLMIVCAIMAVCIVLYGREFIG